MKFKLILLLVAILEFQYFFGQVIFENKIIGVNPNVKPYSDGQTFDSNIIVLGIGREWGLNGMGRNNRYNARDWNFLHLDTNDYFEFTISHIHSLNHIKSSLFGSSLDGFTSNIASPSMSISAAEQTPCQSVYQEALSKCVQG
jgi:hypothetical protein